MKELPDALQPLSEYSQFIVCKISPSKKNPLKMDKLPINHRTNHVSNAHNPEIWLSATDAINKASSLGGRYRVGFVFNESDPFFFLDIDDCLAPDDATWSPLAIELTNMFAGAAVEVSQSNRGLHIFGTYSEELPEHACKNIPLKIELYHKDRFVLLTGVCGPTGSASTDCTPTIISVINQHFPRKSGINNDDNNWSTEPVPEWNGLKEDDELIKKALNSKSGASVFTNRADFSALWNCDEEILAAAYPSSNDLNSYDASSADAALAQHLSFWTGNDCERIRRLMLRSSLVRDKWERKDYLVRTITRAVNLQKEVYASSVAQLTDPLDGPIDCIIFRAGQQILAPSQQAEHFAGCVYVRDQHRIFIPDGGLLKQEQFNATYGGYSFMLTNNGKTTRKAWDVFTESQAILYPWAHSTCFRPESRSGEIVTEEGGRRLLNVYVCAQGKRVKGDVSLFLAHVERLLPDEKDREIFLSYMSACVQHPGIKFQWCVLLQGAEGNGKSIFYNVLAYSMGERYAHLPNAADITNRFNGWIEQKLIIGIEEVHTGGRQEVADTLKPLITNMRIEIHSKGKDQRTGDNRANFIMFSNHKDAVLKTQNDRRYCVFYTAQQESTDLERDGMDSRYFHALHSWLAGGGNGHVAEYLSSRVISVDVMARAPSTSSTTEAVRSSLGVAEQIIQEAIDLEEPGFRGGLIDTKSAREFLKAHGKELGPHKVTEVLSNLEYVRHPALKSSEGKISIEGTRRRIYVKRGSKSAQLTTPIAIAEAWIKSQRGE